MPTDFSSLGIHEDFRPAYAGRLLVLGCARCLWDDLHAAMAMYGPPESWHIMAVNDSIAYCPFPVEHGYSDHADLLQGWADRSRFTPALHTSTQDAPTGIRRWPWPRHGTSTLGAVYTGLALGYDDIVLCGVPLDGTGHFYDPFWLTTPQMQGEERYWRNAVDNVFKDRVRSMSGLTRKLCG